MEKSLVARFMDHGVLYNYVNFFFFGVRSNFNKLKTPDQ